MATNKKRIALYGVFFVIAAFIAYLQIKEYRSSRLPTLPILGKVPEFSLYAEDSTAFTAKEMRGHVTIADFIFTSCAGPCPLMSAQMQQLQHSTSEHPDVRLVSFSVDPETDTPEVLRDYGRRFGAIKGKWTFLTGSKSAIYDITRNGFHLAVEADSEAIAHSTKFVLIDKESTIRGYYDSEDSESMTRLIEDIKSLR